MKEFHPRYNPAMYALLTVILLLSGAPEDTGLSSENYYTLGKRLEESGDLTGALLNYEQALGADPTNGKALEALSDLYVIKGACPRAIRFLSPLARLNPSVSRVWYALAVCQDREGMSVQAVESAAQYRRLAPSDPDGLMVMARALEHTGRYSQAMILYKRVIALGSSRFLDEAKKSVARLAARGMNSGSFADEMYARAVRESARGNGAEAVILALRGLGSVPEHRGLLLLLARLAPLQNKCHRAIHLLRQGTSLYPEEPEILFSYAYCARKTSRFREALWAYRTYVTSFSSDPDGWFGLGETYRLMGRYGAAIAAYRTYLKKEKRSGQQKWKKLARTRIRELGRLVRQMVTARKELQVVRRLIGSGQTDSALRVASAYVSKWPWDPAGHVALADVLMMQRNFRQARRELESAMAMDPGYPDVHRAFGDMYVKLRLTDEAIMAYKRYLALAPRRAPDRRRVMLILSALRSRGH